VELWLHALSDEMKATLKKLVNDCLQERTLDPSKYPSQVGSCNNYCDTKRNGANVGARHAIRNMQICRWKIHIQSPNFL